MKTTNSSFPEVDRLEFLKWILKRRKRFQVTGASMFPVLKPGDEVLLAPHAYRRRQPEVGDIVVAAIPGRKGLRVIKRVAAVNPDGTLHLEGENPFESTDYRSVPPQQLLGKVTCIFSRADPAETGPRR